MQNNIKSIGVANDGNMKRMGITYDVIDDNGDKVKDNVKISKLVTDDDVLLAINQLNDYAQTIVDEAEK